jgi:D-sedoheptulose 7-phosphate isomerase
MSDVKEQQANPVVNTFIAALANLKVAVTDTEIVTRTLLAVDKCLHTLRADGKILIGGNGGSHCSALHFAEELTGRFRNDRPPLGAIALGEAAHTSCVSNDYGFQFGLSRQVEALASKQDVLVLLSTSGNSENLILAATVAKNRGVKTVALLGKGGGQLKNIVDIPIVFPGETSDRIQELHMLFLHLMVDLIERGMFPPSTKKFEVIK